jgi:cell division protein FtsW
MNARLATDWKLFTPIILILAFGLVMVYSASSVVAEIRYGKPTYEFVLRQLVFAIAGIAIMLMLKAADYRRMNHAQWVLVPVGLVAVLLLMVLFADPVAHRWFRFAGMQLQPSEFAKPAIVLFLAWFVSHREAGRTNINDRHTLMPASLVIGVLVGLIAIGDLGTAIVLLVPAAAVFFVAGIERRYFYLTILLGLVLFVVFLVQKPYRILRVMAYVGVTEETVEQNPRLQWLASSIADSRATRDAGHQPHQAKIAVGRGGITGAGLGQSNQKLGFLPEAHTDFIFAVVGEETGLAGSLALLGGYFLIFWRGIRLYWRTGDRFGRYLALGAVSLLTTQALFNISVVVGVLPTKGIALPLVSYGGSALVCTLMLCGLLLSVSDRTAEA